MEPIVDFKILPERLRQAAQVVTVAVASPADSHTEEVIERSIAEQFARFILVANAAKADIARRLAADYPDKVTLIVAEDDDDAARHAVKEVREGRADVLMKGSLNTDNLLRAVLNKEEGILIKGSVLTHIAVADVPSLNHLLFFTDAAVIPYPTTEQFDALAHYITATYRSITGGDRPRVALIHCTEKVSEKFPLTLSYEELKANAANGAYGEVDLSGPMDVKTACDSESARIKGLTSEVTGNADILIFPNIEAANTFYKTITLFAGATTAGMLCGAVAPVVIASRADSAEAKMCSMLMACSLA